ncbi:hypothetical protein HAX54_032828 [Datura stramonium]|uniref:Uncharacterized protein n=1 Tax=Datura stramonium TaxID=4076 RepID=A0ABS8SCW3_DATST|nr:hypothetical protein [Datura stramonium]
MGTHHDSLFLAIRTMTRYSTKPSTLTDATAPNHNPIAKPHESYHGSLLPPMTRNISHHYWSKRNYCIPRLLPRPFMSPYDLYHESFYEFLLDFLLTLLLV